MQVKAILGSNVRLTGKIFPEEANLTFDSNSREVVWKLENLEAGQGVLGTAGPSVAFQLALTPQQAGNLTLVGTARVTGEDEFTGLMTSAEAPVINTADIVQ